MITQFHRSILLFIGITLCSPLFIADTQERPSQSVYVVEVTQVKSGNQCLEKVLGVVPKPQGFFPTNGDCAYELPTEVSLLVWHFRVNELDQDPPFYDKSESVSITTPYGERVVGKVFSLSDGTIVAVCFARPKPSPFHSDIEHACASKHKEVSMRSSTSERGVDQSEVSSNHIEHPKEDLPQLLDQLSVCTSRFKAMELMAQIAEDSEQRRKSNVSFLAYQKATNQAVLLMAYDDSNSNQSAFMDEHRRIVGRVFEIQAAEIERIASTKEKALGEELDQCTQLKPLLHWLDEKASALTGP